MKENSFTNNIDYYTIKNVSTLINKKKFRAKITRHIKEIRRGLIRSLKNGKDFFIHINCHDGFIHELNEYEINFLVKFFSINYDIDIIVFLGQLKVSINKGQIK